MDDIKDNLANEIDHIYEPVSQYKNVYKDLHQRNTNQYLDTLIETSKVDVEANRTTIAQIKKLDEDSRNQANQISKYSIIKGLLIFFSLVAIIVIIYLITYLINYVFVFWYLVIAILMIALTVLLIMLIVKKADPKLKILKDLKYTIDSKIKQLIALACEQMKPLNQLFKYGMSAEVFRKTIPQIKLDTMFDSKRLDYMISKFGLKLENDKNKSTLFVQSGDMYGNPFYICNNLIHRLGEKSYHGSIVISWTTSRIVDGRRVTDRHSQTLTATVQKPCPFYKENPYLVYANDAAPNLLFSREDSNAENMNQKRIDKYVSKDIKKLEKLSEKSTIRGQNYTVMANSEFEVLFRATNRNHEVQFRLLFTPLAQKQMLELMKEKEIGFGDDFAFVKHKKINYIYPEHLSKIDLNAKPEYFQGYDIDIIKERFMTYNEDYLRHIYFSFAPILCIPLYQQNKPQEYIYKDLYDSYVSFYEHENVVNKMNINDFKHPLSQTRNILKTSVVSSGDYCDTVKVTSYGYQTARRVDFVTKLGGDGRFHQVPVAWTEYTPVERETIVDINVVEETKEKSYADRFKEIFERLEKKEVTKRDLHKINNFIALIRKE